MFGRFFDSAWKVFGKLLEGFWIMWTVSGRFLDSAWKVFGKFLESV